MNNSRRNFLRRSSLLAGAGLVAAARPAARAQHKGHGQQQQSPPKAERRAPAA